MNGLAILNLVLAGIMMGLMFLPFNSPNVILLDAILAVLNLIAGINGVKEW